MESTVSFKKIQNKEKVKLMSEVYRKDEEMAKWAR